MNCNSHAHTFSTPPLLILQYPGGPPWPISTTPIPCVCRLRAKAQLISKLWQNFSNQISDKTIPPPPTPTHSCLSPSSQKMSHCFYRSDLSQHSSTHKKKNKKHNTPPVLAIRPEEVNRKKHSTNPMTTSLLNPFLFTLHLTMMTSLEKQEIQKKQNKRKTNNEPPASCVSQIAPCRFSLIQSVAWK